MECEDEIGLEISRHFFFFFFSPLASTSPNELVAQTGVLSHQLRHISVKNGISSGKRTVQDGLDEDGNSFGTKMVPSILISLPCSPVALIKESQSLDYFEHAFASPQSLEWGECSRIPQSAVYV